MPVVEVPLQLKNGRYTFDFDAMERAVTSDVKSFVLCNPHNPVGRIFNQQELLNLVEFCHRHGLVLLADEIHGEFALDAPHIPLFTLSTQALKNTITVTSAGKSATFPAFPWALRLFRMRICANVMLCVSIIYLGEAVR